MTFAAMFHWCTYREVIDNEPQCNETETICQCHRYEKSLSIKLVLLEKVKVLELWPVLS